MPSTGLHTNGYSLARKVLLDDPGFSADDVIPELGCSIGEELLKTHRCYVNELWPLLEKDLIRAMAHITGGGLTDNLPRVIPNDLQATIKVGAWEIPSVFRILAERGEIPEDDLWRTFNMGVGMVLVVSPKKLKKVLSRLREAGCTGFPMGNVGKGDRGVVYDHPPEGFPSGLR